MPLEQLGPYKIERLLGRGGMGAVYAGTNIETGATAAIKVLSPTLGDDPGFRERFQAEIETLKALRHPNIVELYGYGEHDGHLFYAMELVEGRNLQDEMQSGRKFDWREVCRIGIAICQGLKHAHDVGVIHRDLKPANLLITPDGTIKLSDFGIAKLYGSSHLTSDGGVLGTADYMAPEQADGRPVSTRCDMYSLGSVLFALLARRPPFAAPTLPEVLHALRYEEAPPVRRYAPQTPVELEAILVELLDKDPQKRVATPLVLSNRLRAMLHALSSDKAHSGAADDEYVLRESDNARLPLPQQLTMASSDLPGHTGGVDSEVSSTRPMTKSVPEPKGTTVDPPARRFTTVDSQAAKSSDSLPPVVDDGLPLWSMLIAAGLLIAVTGSLAWYFFTPPSADALYKTITVATQADDPAALTNVEPQIAQFLEKYPDDPRREEIAHWQEELEIQGLQRRLEFRARRLRDGESLAPVERAYLDAMAYERTNPTTAIGRLAAIVDLYGGDEKASRETKHCVQLAQKQLATLRERGAKNSAAQQQELADRLNDARRQAKSNPQQALAICRAIVTLYADQAWATETVAAAKAFIAELDQPHSGG